MRATKYITDYVLRTFESKKGRLDFGMESSR